MDIFDSAKQSGQSRQNRSQVLVFTSGKGGVGKTCITTNVATAMVKKGAKVCIFDADTGLANINILLGLRPEYTLEHVLSGKKNISDVIIYKDDGLAVVPGASGIAECANLDRHAAKRLVAALTELESVFDYILIDTAAGIADNVIQFIESAPYAFLVITSEPTSLTDGFSLLKLLNARGSYQGYLRVIVNQATDYTAASETYKRFSAAVDKYMNLNIVFGGFIARDEEVARSVAKQIPVVELAANTYASRCLFAFADNIIKYIGSGDTSGGFSDYWKNLLADSHTDEPVANHLGEPPELIAPLSSCEALKDRPLNILDNLKIQGGNQDEFECFLDDFMTEFVARFGGFPKAFSQLFYRSLEAEDYPAARMVELVATLEALYMSRHQQPMFSVEANAARLIAQSQGSESTLRGLFEQLRASYRQTFQRDVFDIQQVLLDEILSNDFTEGRFESLLRSMQEAFLRRFNRPYRGPSDLLLESTAEALAAIAEEEKQLQAEMARTSERFLQISEHRDALMAAISHAEKHRENLPVRMDNTA